MAAPLGSPVTDADITAEKLPITAISFARLEDKELLLAGEGCKLKVFDVSKHLCIETKRALPPSCRIHGIRHCRKVDRLLVAAFGQQKLHILQFSRDHKLSEASCLFSFEDWILELQWLSEDSVVAMVMAHNYVLLWNWLDGSLINRVPSAVSCILYSARIYGNTIENMVVASGTVFNQVLLWRLLGNKEKDCVRVNTTLKGHEGVIFGVRFSECLSKVCSVSDDRTVRVWALPEDWTGQYERVVLSAQLVLFGHEARVWDSLMLKECIVSIGEDATLRLWSYRGDCIGLLEAHKGRNIWSVAVSEDQTLLATGGGDCSIRLLHLNKDTTANQLVYTLSALSESDFVRAVKLCSPSTLLCFTNEGVCCAICFKPHEKEFQVHPLWKDRDFGSYCAIDLLPRQQLVALGNLTGQVKIAKMVVSEDGVGVKKVHHFKAHKGKVFSLQLMAPTTGQVMILTCGPEGEMVMWMVNTDINDREFLTVSKQSSLYLPLSKHRWLCTTLLQSTSHGQYLVGGDRRGSIHVYLLTTESDVIIKPVCSLQGIHGNHGVSHLGADGLQILSAGRRGYIYRHVLQPNGNLQEVARQRVFKGFDWIEQIILERKQFIVTGFHSTKFIVHDVTESKTLVDIECGGVHRSWDFASAQFSKDVHGFVFLKDSNIHFHFLRFGMGPSQIILQDAFHGREVKCLVVLERPGRAGSVTGVTGGEDTLAMISKIESTRTGHSVSVTQSIEGHISSVKCLTVSNCADKGKSLLFSGGGRASLKSWEIELLDEPHMLHLSSVILQSVSDRKRRQLMHRVPPRNHLVPPDCRIMALTAFPAAQITGTSPCLGNLHCVAAACSDSILRVFVFNSKEEQFDLLSDLDHDKCCLFSLRHVTVPATPTAQGHAHLVVGGSDGSIHIWNITDTLSKVFLPSEDMPSDDPSPPDRKVGVADPKGKSHKQHVIPLHQSGVNSIDIVKVSDSGWLVATGGDDTMLTVALCNFNCKIPELVHLARRPSAHHSSITGVQLCSGGAGVVTASVDQRVSLWRVHQSPEHVDVQHLQTILSDVSDIASLSCWESEGNDVTACVVGIGLQCFKFPLKDV